MWGGARFLVSETMWFALLPVAAGIHADLFVFNGTIHAAHGPCRSVTHVAFSYPFVIASYMGASF